MEECCPCPIPSPCIPTTPSFANALAYPCYYIPYSFPAPPCKLEIPLVPCAPPCNPCPCPPRLVN
ncbi:sperm mitochondrial-associated cysteine-rich protein-like [Anoplophora glabripennis]|uniref:sperm mitochondrial-associated cysteine-rich protein-like n=1 Tax=Anoplophora glabripennis TaxID=217634 RepID=UPI0008746B8F|nr:sperm mitochondrial-associated cysteine-rich protein-like [Anoplophora glabripennis]